MSERRARSSSNLRIKISRVSADIARFRSTLQLGEASQKDMNLSRPRWSGSHEERDEFKVEITSEVVYNEEPFGTRDGNLLPHTGAQNPRSTLTTKRRLSSKSSSEGTAPDSLAGGGRSPAAFPAASKRCPDWSRPAPVENYSSVQVEARLRHFEKGQCAGCRQGADGLGASVNASRYNQRVSRDSGKFVLGVIRPNDDNLAEG